MYAAIDKESRHHLSCCISIPCFITFLASTIPTPFLVGFFSTYNNIIIFIPVHNIFQNLIHPAEIFCQALSAPENGQIRYSTSVTSGATYNTTATYSCDLGYGLSGVENVRTCEGDGNSLDGMWSGNAPTCEGNFLISSSLKPSRLLKYLPYSVNDWRVVNLVDLSFGMFGWDKFGNVASPHCRCFVMINFLLPIDSQTSSQEVWTSY